MDPNLSVEGSSVCVLSVDGHLVSPTDGIGLLIFALRVLYNKEVAAITQEHAITLTAKPGRRTRGP